MTNFTHDQRRIVGDVKLILIADGEVAVIDELHEERVGRQHVMAHDVDRLLNQREQLVALAVANILRGHSRPTARDVHHDFANGLLRIICRVIATHAVAARIHAKFSKALNIIAIHSISLLS